MPRDEAPKMGRPRLDPAAARVNKSIRAAAITWAKLDAEAKRTGKGVGQVLDDLVERLPAP